MSEERGKGKQKRRAAATMSNLACQCRRRTGFLSYAGWINWAAALTASWALLGRGRSMDEAEEKKPEREK
jgi:hypothetical protein